MDRLAALVELQGSSFFARIDDGAFDRWRTGARRRGLSTTHYARWLGADAAARSARALLKDHPLPPDLEIRRIGPDTPDEALAQLADVALSCGVLPPSGAVLRGRCKPGLGLVAVDRAGRGVACAGAASFWHPDHPDGRRQCWWGMLATLPERRGQRLALVLGALALIEMRERFVFSEVFTGIEPGNAPSEAACARLGLRPEGKSVLSVADPGRVPGGRMTK